MPELLIELFSEEIPARMQVRAADDFKRLVTDKLTASGLTLTQAEAHSTPRRIALMVDGLPARQADVTEEKKGPRVGSPDAAIQGFLKGAGLKNLDQAEVRKTDKGDFYFAVVTRHGRDTREALADILKEAITGLPWPKSMRWGSSTFRWVRPLHSIIALFDGQVIDLEVDGVKAGNTTQGHRFLAPAAFAVKNFADYKVTLHAASVVLNREDRKKTIQIETEKLAKAAGLTVKNDPGLLEEVIGLVEWPVALMGTIDQTFMDVPPEVLTTSMRTHQRYFALETKDGKLASRFVVIANRPTNDGGKAVTAGNERVLRARLSDAKFFWDHDLRKPLEDNVAALANITFHEKLGSLKDKVERVEALAVEIGNVFGAPAQQVKLAAHLCKADLVTGVVGEFPEVQGIAGRYIALEKGEDPAVANAIADHYKPLGPSDTCPKDPVSIAVALADKIDTLVGFFAIDEKPTGSRDPFALRRAALGVIRLIVENELRLNLLSIFNAHSARFTKQMTEALKRRLDGKAIQPSFSFVETDLLSFFADRLKVVLKEKGVRHDLIDAVFSLGNEDDLVRLLARVDALSQFLNTEDGANLLTAYRRAANILKIEEKKDGQAYDAAPDEKQLSQAEEKALNTALNAAEKAAAEALAKEDFTGTMAALARLRAPVDAFFDKVTVNVADDKALLRANRLRLLSRIRTTLNQVADFSRIEG